MLITLEWCCSEFYTVIPHDFGFKHMCKLSTQYLTGFGMSVGTWKTKVIVF